MFYRIIKALGVFYAKVFYFLKTTGRENTQMEGAFIIAPNHMSMHDVIFVSASMQRQIYYMAKSELFKNRLLGWLIRKLGGFPVQRGKQDITAIKTSLQILKRGDVLGIFPEGTRVKQGENVRAKTGVALFAYKTKRPVVPVGISTKDQKRRLFRRVYVNFGTPITFEEFAFADGGAQELQRASNIIMERVHDLMGQGR